MEMSARQASSDETRFSSYMGPRLRANSQGWRLLDETSADIFRIENDGTVITKGVVQGDHSILTIAAGAVTVTTGFHRVDTEGGAATDDLDTINGGTEGQILVIKSTAGTKDVTLKDGTGNLILAGDMLLDTTSDTITLIKVGSTWQEIARSNNA
ncbi:hypothetical protein [Ensifer aridi]|uniref:hypothetical protein n=1 Tax=Ensifer aridi TaxID=1708715 RepID=UPI00111176E4|nr:hypothetical protein [Ensifer aridi]